MTYKLPLFPLETVLFPGTPILLHIFEARYKLMIKHLMETGQPFGVVLIRQGVEAFGPLPQPYSIGCTARIVSVEKLGKERLNLVAMGDERFRVVSLEHTKPYLVGDVNAFPLEDAGKTRSFHTQKSLNELVYKYIDLLKLIGTDVYKIADLQLPEEQLAMLYLSAALLQIPAPEKQPLLESQSVQDLLSQLARLYKREIAVVSTLHRVNDRTAARAAQLN